MKAAIFRYATAFTTGLFAVIGLSGVALFYRLQSAALKPMHEWLGLVLVGVAVLHIWRNWAPLKGYFRRGALYAPLALTLLVSCGFVWASIRSPAPADPSKQILRAVARAPLTQIAPLLHSDGEALAARLRDKGFTVDSTAQSLADIGQSSGRNEREALALLLEGKQKP